MSLLNSGEQRYIKAISSDVNGENDMNMSGGVLVDVCSDVNGENDVNMSGGVAVGVCDDVNIGKDRSTSEGVPADMCSDVCNDVNTKNDVWWLMYAMMLTLKRI